MQMIITYSGKGWGATPLTRKLAVLDNVTIDYAQYIFVGWLLEGGLSVEWSDVKWNKVSHAYTWEHYIGELK